jgi:hypothetical protein
MFEILRNAIWISAFAAFAVAIAFKDFRAIEQQQPTVSHYKYAPWNTDPNRPVSEILGDIKEAAVQWPEHISYVLAPFAALLARLAEDDAATARNLLLATYVLLGVTVVLVALTVCQLVGTEVISDWLKKIFRKYRRRGDLS